MIRPYIAPLLFLMSTVPSFAAPKVVTDIPPIYSLVSAVMQGVGTPDLLLDGAASPHDAQLRPSQARELQDAALVVFVSRGLAPAVTRQVDALAGDAVKLELITTTADRQLAFDDGDTDAHADHDEHKDDEHAEDAHDDHAEDGHDDHDDHKDEHEDDHKDEHAGHAHEGGIDPHAWLDVISAQVWVREITEALVKLDPQNATTYTTNQTALLAELAVLQSQIRVPDTGKFIAYHDALGYFARHDGDAGLPIVGFIKDSEARAPSAKHLRALRQLVADQNVVCVLVEPGFDPALVAAVADKTPMVSLDILGQGIEPSSTSYVTMMRGLMASIQTCAGS